MSEDNLVPDNMLPAAIFEWKKKHPAIWYRGDLSLLDLPKVSVVGSRSITKEGISRTRKLVEILVENGFCIVSGLARGVDTIAHQAALMVGGKTISVMGTPIDEIYPKENLALKQNISKFGLVLSHFPPGTPIRKFNFPQRNDLMAMMSKVTIVVEAGEGSGTRHQIESALKYGRVAAFVKSLADSNVSWVNKALHHRNSLVVSEEEEFINYINHLKVNTDLGSYQPNLFSVKK